MIERRMPSFSDIALISQETVHQADFMMLETCILEDAGMYSNVRGSNPNGELICLCRSVEGGLELSCVHFSDSLSWDTECG